MFVHSMSFSGGLISLNNFSIYDSDLSGTEIITYFLNLLFKLQYLLLII